MEPGQILYNLQMLDLRIAADGAKLEAERGKIGEPPAVRQGRASLKSLEAQLAGFQTELRSTEQEAASITGKKAAVHAKLYGGSTSVPRELAALGAEETGLAQTLSQLEDRELELMTSAEQAEKSLATGQQRLQEQLDLWREQGSEAHEHIAHLETEVAELQTERAELATQVSPANLATYERLRPRKANRPVALVEKNMCQGCRVDLPSGDVNRARGADPPHTCDNCGRILYVR